MHESQTRVGQFRLVLAETTQFEHKLQITFLKLKMLQQFWFWHWCGKKGIQLNINGEKRSQQDSELINKCI